MNKKLSIDEFDELDKEQKNNYLNTLNVFDDNNDPVLLTLKERFIEEHGKTGRLEEVIVTASDGLYPTTLVVRVNRKSGKTRIPTYYQGLWVRKWYKDAAKQ